MGKKKEQFLVVTMSREGDTLTWGTPSDGRPFCSRKAAFGACERIKARFGNTLASCEVSITNQTPTKEVPAT